LKFAVIGGDKRTEILCSLLASDGHRVFTYALEKAAPTPGVTKVGCLQGCVYGADYIILPVPAENSGLLSAPLSDEVLEVPKLIEALWSGQIICGGKFSDESCTQAISSGIYIEDIMRRPAFVWGNAALTAEAALGIVLRNAEKTLSDCLILITGWGRIGKLLALKLKALGADVTVASRRGGHRAEAYACGFRSCDYDTLAVLADGFDFVVNTAPGRVLGEKFLCALKESAVLLELASSPGGYDRTLCANLGLNSISAPGLPGRCLPYSAAELIRDSIYDIIDEQEDRA